MPRNLRELRQQSELKVENVSIFLNKVQEEFKDEPNGYSEFLKIIKEFRRSEIDASVVVQRIAELFRGRPDLIIGANHLLPQGYELSITDDGIMVTEPNGQKTTVSSQEFYYKLEVVQ